MDIITIIGGFILTAAIYLAVPLIRLLINNGRFSPKRAHRIALWNSIVLGLIFCILTIEFSENGTVWNAAPAVIYYWVNKAILTDKNAANPVAKGNNKSSNKQPDKSSPLKTNEKDSISIQLSDPNETPKKHGDFSVPLNDLAFQQSHEPPRVSYCRKCGVQLIDGSQFCRKCGTYIVIEGTHNEEKAHITKIKRMKKTKPIIIGIFIIVVIALISILIAHGIVNGNNKEIYNVAVRTISFSDEFTAEFVLELWRLGDATEQTMIQIMDEYGAEQGGGKLYIITPGEFVDEIDEWCFSNKRKAGDYAIIENANGYTLCYFSGRNIDE